MTTAADAAWAHDPDAVTRADPRRADRLLPFDPATMPPDAPVMLDTNVYIARAQDRLPDHIVHVIAARTVLHCGVALSELSISAGLLDPKDKRTSRYREPLRALFDDLKYAGCNVHLIGGADVAAELDAKRAIDQGTRLAAVI